MLRVLTAITGLSAFYSVYLPSVQATIFNTGVMIACAIIMVHDRD